MDRPVPVRPGTYAEAVFWVEGGAHRGISNVVVDGHLESQEEIPSGRAEDLHRALHVLAGVPWPYASST